MSKVIEVVFSKTLPKLGDANRYEFLATRQESKGPEKIIVRVSRTLAVTTGDEESVRKTAAMAVSLHIQGKLTEEDYKNGEINLTSYSKDKETSIDTYERFEVNIPKKGMGFTPRSN